MECTRARVGIQEVFAAHTVDSYLTHRPTTLSTITATKSNAIYSREYRYNCRAALPMPGFDALAGPAGANRQAMERKTAPRTTAETRYVHPTASVAKKKTRLVATTTTV